MNKIQAESKNEITAICRRSLFIKTKQAKNIFPSNFPTAEKFPHTKVVMILDQLIKYSTPNETD